MKPSSLEEAIAIIREEFLEKNINKWAALSEDKACSQAHFSGVGVWIRNEWVYGGSCPLVYKIREHDQFIHNDNISDIIVKALWQVLNGYSCPSIKGQ